LFNPLTLTINIEELERHAMAVVSVNLSSAAQVEWERIPRGKRSAVLSDYLVSRSLDLIDPTEGVSGHELAAMVKELREAIESGRRRRDALRAQVREMETNQYTSLTAAERERAKKLAAEAKAEVEARLKEMEGENDKENA
jgi:hypothetical protein